MGFFSKKADDLLANSTETGRAAYKAARGGEKAVGAAYKAQSDDAFQQWLDQTKKDHDAKKNGRR